MTNIRTDYSPNGTPTIDDKNKKPVYTRSHNKCLTVKNNTLTIIED